MPVLLVLIGMGRRDGAGVRIAITRLSTRTIAGRKSRLLPNCGGVGCVEQICSATGIAREARRKMEASDKPSALREYGADVTAKDVLDAAKAGDELANEVMDVVGRYLGLALSMAVMIVDPEIFVIGGGVSKAGQFLIDVIQKHYDYFTPISEYKGKLGLATLGNDAGIWG